MRSLLRSWPARSLRVLYAFFTRSLHVFYLAQNRGLRQKQVVRCGPPQPPGCGAGLEVWQFTVACVPRATRHGRAIPEHTAPAESACFHGRSAASRPSLATRILPRFYRVLYAFFYSDHRQRVLYAFFTRFLRVFSFLAPYLGKWLAKIAKSCDVLCRFVIS